MSKFDNITANSINPHMQKLYRESPRIEKAEEVDLSKGGEGSKGGKIIGHTKSGKAIYEGHHSSFGTFTHADHLDAAEAHSTKKSTAIVYQKIGTANKHTAAQEYHLKEAERVKRLNHQGFKPDGSKKEKPAKEDSKTLADRYKELKDSDDKGETTHNDIVSSMKGSHGASKKEVEAALKEHGVGYHLQEKYDPKKRGDNINKAYAALGLNFNEEENS